jgi:hypothetical protein
MQQTRYGPGQQPRRDAPARRDPEFEERAPRRSPRRFGRGIATVLGLVLALVATGIVAVILVRPGGSDGPRIEGDKYSYGLPEGWQDQPELHKLFRGPGAEALQVLSSSPDPARLPRDGYVSVVRAPTGKQVNLERSVTAFITGASTNGIKAQLRGSPRRVELAGAQAIQFEFLVSARDLELRGIGVNAVQGDQLYTVALSGLTEGFDRSTARFRHITDTWRWR